MNEINPKGKLCEETGEYLCSYCMYSGRLGHCQYYQEVYFTQIYHRWFDLREAFFE